MGKAVIHLMKVFSQRWHDKCIELKSNKLDGEEMTDFRDNLEVNQQDAATDWLDVRE